MTLLTRVFLLGLALAAWSVCLPGATAAIVTTGNIYQVLDVAGADRGSTIDYWYFDVLSGGQIEIDTLSWEQDGEDRFDNDNDFVEPVDVNGDGEIAYLDPHIHLFADDGSLDLADLLASNDDSSFTYFDGSIYAFDSFMSLPLAPGSYVLAIGAFDFTPLEAIVGNNPGTFYPVTSNEFGLYTEIDHGDYQITWTGDLQLTGTRLGVPEPASFLIAGLGSLALLARRRR
jgi:hypothetical protein